MLINTLESSQEIEIQDFTVALGSLCEGLIISPFYSDSRRLAPPSSCHLTTIRDFARTGSDSVLETENDLVGLAARLSEEPGFLLLYDGLYGGYAALLRQESASVFDGTLRRHRELDLLLDLEILLATVFRRFPAGRTAQALAAAILDVDVPPATDAGELAELQLSAYAAIVKRMRESHVKEYATVGMRMRDRMPAGSPSFARTTLEFESMRADGSSGEETAQNESN
jgi:hypothetical protein